MEYSLSAPRHWHMTLRPAVAWKLLCLVLLSSSPSLGRSFSLAVKLAPPQGRAVAFPAGAGPGPSSLLGYDRLCQDVSEKSLSHSRKGKSD